jgi:DNA polymerase elongation subunit (family B)
MYRTNNINDTELVYSLLREKYPDNQVHISYDNIDKEYTLTLTQNPYKKDPEVQVDFFTRVIYGDTDSIFVEIKFNRKDFRKNREDTFKLASICGDNVTDKIFNRQPICLEFEKVFQPFILLTKKRYIGKKFENMKEQNAEHTKKIVELEQENARLNKKIGKSFINIVVE